MRPNKGRNMNTFSEAFEELIKDMYSAEKQALKALPKMAKGCADKELRTGFEKHLEQTQGHVDKLEKVAEICGFKPTGKLCVGAKGLIEEVEEQLEEGEEGPVRDAMLIAGAQKFEHYEISGYGTACDWAKLMGEKACAELLDEILEEEKATDMLLNSLAESKVNPLAFETAATEAA